MRCIWYTLNNKFVGIYAFRKLGISPSSEFKKRLTTNARRNFDNNMSMHNDCGSLSSATRSIVVVPRNDYHTTSFRSGNHMAEPEPYNYHSLYEGDIVPEDTHVDYDYGYYMETPVRRTL
jgi:hypothetical protein